MRVWDGLDEKEKVMDVIKEYEEVTNEVEREAPNDTAYTRWSCDSGLANTVQIVSTPPAPNNGGPITVFWGSRPCEPAGWLAMLLIKSQTSLDLRYLPQTNTS